MIQGVVRAVQARAGGEREPDARGQVGPDGGGYGL